jgi:hypothetical protein
MGEARNGPKTEIGVEWSAQMREVKKSEIERIEFMLRQGRKQLKTLANPNVGEIRFSRPDSDRAT